jgi:hypothetical protein
MNRALVAVVALIIPMTAKGADTGPIIAYPPQNDTVTMVLNLEDWVQTQTARTNVAVDAALPGSDAGKTRAQMQAAVKELVQGADWRFISFDRTQDVSGLERWHAVLEARLPEAQLGGLSDRAKQASKPGMQISVQTIDFTPTLAEIEAAKAKLRGEMYKKVNESLAQLNQAEPDRKYRIQNIFFNEPMNVPQPMARAQYANALAGAPVSVGALQEPPISLSDKIHLTVNITFAALAPRE